MNFHVNIYMRSNTVKHERALNGITIIKHVVTKTSYYRRLIKVHISSN